MAFVSEKNIDKVSFLYAIIVVGVMTFSTGSLFIIKKVDTMKKDLLSSEQEFIAEQKLLLKKDVELLIKRVDSRRLSVARRMQERLRERVSYVRTIAAGIYETMNGQFPEETIKEVVKEAIRPLRFNQGLGYFFIIALDGTSVLYPVAPEREGKNHLKGGVWDNPETIERLLEVARKEGRGFAHYRWAMPGDASGRLHEKVSYVSLFEEFGWVIGTGEYLENLNLLGKEMITGDLAASLADIGTDYYFVYDLHNADGGPDFATMLINNNRPDLVGSKLSDDYRDAKGKEFRKEFLKGIREQGEAFVVYWYKKPGDGADIGRKLSYFKLYPEWNWVLARGIYFDRLEAVLSEQKQEISRKVRNDIIMLCIIFLAAVTVALFVAYRFSKGLQRIFDSYRTTQQDYLEKLELLNKTLKRQSRTDALTQIFNRRYFNVQLTREFSRAIRYKSRLSVILLDIDYFKIINDTYGHLAGDMVLQEIAQLIQDNIRKSDILARWGGEEFAILAPGISIGQALQFAEKLRQLVEGNEFSIDRQVTCSFGVSSYVSQDDEDAFLQRADTALYQAKQTGRNRCMASGGDNAETK